MWLAGALLCPVWAYASFCTVDVTPAATVLVPYFEVDLSAADGPNTLVHLHNRSPEATLARVTLWTDRSIPTIGFDLFLTGYDVVRLDLRDVFAGSVPATADSLADPGDAISPHGAHPEWDASFSGCEQSFPPTHPQFSGPELDRLVNGHTGQPVQVAEDELCLATDHGDDQARGYLTIDDAVRCASLSPADPGYFGGTNPVASNDNQLWAEVWWTDESRSRRASLPAVHLEADLAAVPEELESGTFYGRYLAAGEDRRERLPSAWGISTLNNPAVTDDWIVWRDSDRPIVQGYTCGEADSWTPLGDADVLCFDEQENPMVVCPGGECLGLEAQRIVSWSLYPSSGSGWCRFDVSSADSGTVSYHQSWVAVMRQSVPGTGDAGALTATPLGPSCPPLPLFVDGFETGDTTVWSSTAGGAS